MPPRGGVLDVILGVVFAVGLVVVGFALCAVAGAVYDALTDRD